MDLNFSIKIISVTNHNTNCKQNGVSNYLSFVHFWRRLKKSKNIDLILISNCNIIWRPRRVRRIIAFIRNLQTVHKWSQSFLDQVFTLFHLMQTDVPHKLLCFPSSLSFKKLLRFLQFSSSSSLTIKNSNFNRGPR